MATYQSSADVRESLSDDELAALVDKIPAYSRVDKLATLDMSTMTPGILHAFADLAAAIRESHPTAELTGLSITVEKSPSDLEEFALSTEASHRYYAEQRAERGES